MLGLTDHVPAQLVYLTDGPAHRVKIGAQTIQLKPARPSRFPGAGTPAGLALQAIRAAGPNANKDFVVRQLSRALSARDRAQLAKLIKHAPAWSHEIIRQFKGTYMDAWARATPEDRAALFNQTAVTNGISPEIVEKDFWVCWTLHHVFQLRDFPRLIFKGGTSLP